MGDSELQRIESCVEWCETSPGSPQAREALQVLNHLRTRQDVWAIGLQLFTQSQQPVARNFGLTLLKEYLSSSDPSPQARQELRNTLPQWLRYSIEQNQLGQEAPYLRAGVAHIFTLMIKCDYPEFWPTAFGDLLDITASGGEPALDVMLQILKEMEDEIVTFSSTRTESEAVHNTAIKDAMRASDATDRIVALLYEVLSVPDQHTEDVVARAIGVLQDLAAWVNINLVVNDQFVPMLYAFLEHPNPTLRSGAAGCWKEIVLRGMDEQSKVELLQSVRILDILQRVRVDDNTVSAVVEFASATFYHMMGVVAQLTSRVQPDSEVGVMLSSLLEQSLGLVLQCLGNDELEGSSKVSHALEAFVSVLKQQSGDRVGGQLFVAVNQLPQVLMAICNRLRYPEDFQFDMDDDDEAEEEALKHYLRRTFINIARIYPSVCLDLITSVLCSLPQPLSSAPFPETEVALRLVYHFGEAAKGKNAALQESTFPSLVVALLESDVDQHPHWSVLLMYYEVCARYSWVMKDRPNLLEKVIGALLSQNGLRNDQPTLRARSCYQLLKILEAAGAAAVPYLGPIMHSLQDILFAVPSEGFLSSDEFQHLYSGIGALCAVNPPVDAQQQLSVCEEVMTGILGAISEILNNPAATHNKGLYSELLAHRLLSLASLTKGFRGAVPDELMPVFENSMQAAAATLSAFGSFSNVRARFITLFHRMLVCAKDKVLPGLGDALLGLVVCAEPSDLEHVVALLNNIVIEFNGACISVMNQLLVPILQKRAECLAQFAQEGDAPHQATVRTQLDKTVFLFLQQISGRGCAAILYSEENSAYLSDLLSTMLQVFVEATDVSLRKSCVISLSNLVQAWGADDTCPVQTPFFQFMYDQALPTILTACVNGSINRTDAEGMFVVADIGSLLSTMLKVRGQEFLQYLDQVVGRSLSWTAAHIQQLTAILSEQKDQSVRDMFKRFVQALP